MKRNASRSKTIREKCQIPTSFLLFPVSAIFNYANLRSMTCLIGAVDF